MSGFTAADWLSVRSLLARRVFDHGLRVLRVVIVLPMIAPADLGLFRFFAALLGVLPVLHGGFLTTMMFQIPIADGKGEHQKQSELLYMGLTASIIGGIVGAGYLLISLAVSEIHLSAFWYAIILLSVFVLPSAFVSGYLASVGNFATQARIEAISSASAFFAAVIGTYYWGVGGLVASAVLGPMMICGLGTPQIFAASKKRPSLTFWITRLRVSLTYFASVSITKMCRVADVVAIGYLLGTSSVTLGLYGLGVTVGGVVSSLVTAVSQVFGFKLLRATDTPPQRRYSLVCDFTIRDSLLAIVLSGMVLSAVSVVVLFWLPEYVDAIAILPVFLMAAVLLRWRTYSAVVLNAAEKTKWINVGSLLGVAMTLVVLAMVHWRLNDSLAAYACCSAVAYLLESMVVMYFAFKQLDRAPLFLPFVGRLWMAHCPLAIWLGVCLCGVDPVWVILSGLLVPLCCFVTFHRIFPDALAEFRSMIGNRLAAKT